MADYELFTTTTATELWERIDVASERFADLVASLSPTLAVQGSTWCTRDVVGHVLTVVRRYTQGATLGDTPRDVDRINDGELAALGQRSRDDLLADVRSELKLAREMFAPEHLDLHMRVPFHGGAEVDVAAALSNLAGEFLIHGRDVARTAGRPWRLEERDAVLILNGVVQILPAYANRAATSSLRLMLVVRGARPWLLAFDRGQLVSKAARDNDRADVVIRVPASTLTLAMYSRVSSAQAVRGGMRVVGGRRPWRVLHLGSLLEKP